MTDTVRHVLFYVGLKPSGNLMLAEMEDGTYCLVRDDQPLPQHRWSKDQLPEAVAAFHAMKLKLATDR